MNDLVQDESDKNVERWRLKKLIENLEGAKGNGTSVISLFITPRDQLPKITSILQDEHATSTSFPTRHRSAVQTAIRACLGRLKLYKNVPPNGLVVYCGTVLTDDNEEKTIIFDFEPLKTISRSVYHCDSKFHTEELRKMLAANDKFGFIVMDGSGTLFATLSGSQREVIHRLQVDLPNKHNCGGQSTTRFARMCEERRHNYVHKVAELATQFFILNDRPNVAGLVLAGSADFKDDLSSSELFDPRLKTVVVAMVNVAHPGEVGLNQAIDMSSDVLSGVKLVQEKRLLQKFLDEVALNTGQYCFAIRDTIKALRMGAVHTLIVWEELVVNRYTITNPVTGEVQEKILTASEASKLDLQKDARTSMQTLEVDVQPLVEWLAESYKTFGCSLEFITNRSQEGAQFVRGFGGIGGILRYKIDFVQLGAAGDETVDHALEDDFT